MLSKKGSSTISEVIGAKLPKKPHDVDGLNRLPLTWNTALREHSIGNPPKTCLPRVQWHSVQLWEIDNSPNRR